jgi:GTPase SAR1 family protein
MPTIKLVVIGASGVGKTSLRGQVGQFNLVPNSRLKFVPFVYSTSRVDSPMVIERP